MCEGYAPPVVKQIRPVRKTPVKLLQGPRIVQNPSSEVPGDYFQRRSFHYFRARHMADTPGNFEPAFWETLVLRFSHNFPTVKQSLVALSCMYEEYERCPSPQNADPFRFSPLAVHQYTLVSLLSSCLSTSILVLIAELSCFSRLHSHSMSIISWTLHLCVIFSGNGS